MNTEAFWIFPQLCSENEGLPTCSESGLRALTFPLELCLLSENSGRAYRYCLSRGAWQTLENSTDIWQDNSECAEDDSFKQKVSWLGSVRADLRAQTTLCRGSTQGACPSASAPDSLGKVLGHTKPHLLWQTQHVFCCWAEA